MNEPRPIIFGTRLRSYKDLSNPNAMQHSATVIRIIKANPMNKVERFDIATDLGKHMTLTEEELRARYEILGAVQKARPLNSEQYFQAGPYAPIRRTTPKDARTKKQRRADRREQKENRAGTIMQMLNTNEKGGAHGAEKSTTDQS